jgi:hypothetical protein
MIVLPDTGIRGVVGLDVAGVEREDATPSIVAPVLLHARDLPRPLERFTDPREGLARALFLPFFSSRLRFSMLEERLVASSFEPTPIFGEVVPPEGLAEGLTGADDPATAPAEETADDAPNIRFLASL